MISNSTMACIETSDGMLLVSGMSFTLMSMCVKTQEHVHGG